uniref:aldo/keto reductase n=1 Tax=Enterocloster clostridioformis TaxID=1531 RepID=UPI002ED6BD04
MISIAVDMGYTFFDTAECYLGNRADGTLAHNEDLVGVALKPYRNQVKIATKCGVQHSPEGLVMDSHPETIRKAIEGSLTRLQTDHVDLYYQHKNRPSEASPAFEETSFHFILFPIKMEGIPDHKKPVRKHHFAFNCS